MKSFIMLLGNNKHVHRGLRINIPYHPKLLVLINNVGLQLSFYDFTKDILYHKFSEKSYLYDFKRFLTSSTIFSNGIVSCIPVSISLKIIVSSNASFCPNIKANLTSSLLAILNCDLMLSRPNEDLVSTPAFLKDSKRRMLFLLAASPS